MLKRIVTLVCGQYKCDLICKFTENMCSGTNNSCNFV